MSAYEPARPEPDSLAGSANRKIPGMAGSTPVLCLIVYLRLPLFHHFAAFAHKKGRKDVAFLQDLYIQEVRVTYTRSLCRGVGATWNQGKDSRCCAQASH